MVRFGEAAGPATERSLAPKTRHSESPFRLTGFATMRCFPYDRSSGAPCRQVECGRVVSWIIELVIFSRAVGRPCAKIQPSTTRSPASPFTPDEGAEGERKSDIAVFPLAIR